MTGQRLKYLSWFLRLAGLAVFPAVFLINRNLLSDAIDTIGDLSIPLFVVAVVLMLIASVVRALRWRVLAEAAGVHYASFLDYLSIYYSGLFLGIAIPQLAASFAPVVFMAEDGHSWKRPSVSILFDRLLESVAILAVAALAAFYLMPSHTTLSLVVLAISFALLGAIAFAFLIAFRWENVSRRLERTPLRRLAERAAVLASDEARTIFRNVRAGAAQLTFLSTTVVVLQVAVVVTLAEALGVQASVAFLAAAASLVVLVVMLPISVAGLGSREGMLILLFTAAGEPREDAIALGVLLFFVSLIARLPGMITLVRRNTHPASPGAEPMLPLVETRAAIVD